MSSSSDDDSEEAASLHAPTGDTMEEPDEDTLRVLVSTDNHLGYLESDPIRGMDSFAAFEEVLYLAKRHKVDCILLGGDLFHHNKPSRRTMHKTIEILRRYTMGPDPVKIQILSDPKRDFRGAGCVNYEDANYSVDLPIFSIHGNHDDPTRDGGVEMLAALDLLAISNLVNYFGRQDQVDKVEVSPVLIQKGTTKVALYGLGNMRDERLNRMWQQKKVQFLRPDGEDEQADDEQEWFNIFILHQNRDNMGRGSKNCIHESMIPSWMDLTVFGHEHASEPRAAESVVGTFRITQPGSSVATSLTDGESVRKHAIVMDVRNSQFKIDPIPLTQVRSFVMHDIGLSQHHHLDPEDPRVDQKITEVLEECLHTQMVNAREKRKTLLQDAAAAGNYAKDSIKYKMNKPDQPLVRLRVEHSGFTTLNNQRFGARFVGKVANPTDILLFQRAKKERATASRKDGSKGSKKNKKKNPAGGDDMDEPMVPVELQQTSVEDLIMECLESSEEKLIILKEKDLSIALEEFVDKMEANAIPDMTTHAIERRQKMLRHDVMAEAAAKKKKDESLESRETILSESMEQESSMMRSMDQDDSMMTRSVDPEDSMMRDESRESTVSTNIKRKRSHSIDLSDDDSIDKENQEASKTKGRGKAAPKKSRAAKNVSIDPSSDEDEAETPVPKKKPSSRVKKAAPSRSGSGDIRKWTQSARASQDSKVASTTKRSRAKQRLSDDEDEDEDEDSVVEIVTKAQKRSSPRRRTNKSKVNYSVDKDSEDDEFGGDSSPEAPPPKRKQTAKASRSKVSQDDSFDLEEDWGTASTRR